MEKQRTGVGRRKEAVTRVFLVKGDGKIIIND
jgi:small subunit ribosomal protein S9